MITLPESEILPGLDVPQQSEAHVPSPVPDEDTPARPLNGGQFRLIAQRGFGDGENSYPYSYRWFKNHLYIGTNRNILLILKKRFRFQVPLDPWPVEVPEGDLDPESLCAQIWRYDPSRDHWDRVYRSPLVPGLEDRTVPLASGFRNMAIFQGRSDATPCIYAIASCGSYGIGPVLFRCEDGSNFEVASEQGMGLGDPNVTAFRGAIPFKGRLFVAPGGSRGFDPNVSYNATVLCTDDPAKGGWQKSCEPFFGDSTNLSIFELGATDDFLYAGTANIRQGAQLWKTDGEGPAPHKWTKVFDYGAGRGPLNQGVVCMTPFRGALYIGTGIQNGGFDRVNSVGPAAAEVLRIWPDDSFDLLCGDPRMTPWGFKVPLSGLGPGFDNPFAGYMWRCGIHDGAVYFGNYDSTTFVQYAILDAKINRLLPPDVIDRFLDFRGGFDVWRSVDGTRWAPLTRNGFGNRFNFGVRTILGTPKGLFIGGANPFGPRVAVRHADGYRYEDNTRGGCDIFYGSDKHEVEDLHQEPTEVRIRSLETSLRETQARSLEEERVVQPLAVHLSSILDELKGLDVALTDDSIAAFVSRIPMRSTESLDDRELRKLADLAIDPLLRLAAEEDVAPMAADAEQELDDYFGGGPRNAGLWRRDNNTPIAAAQLLIEDLAEHIPEGPQSVLVGAEGLPAVLRLLEQRRDDLAVTALVFDDETERICEQRGIDRVRASTDRFDLGGDRYDVVLWIELPEKLGRERALAQARRVLVPGGKFLVSDLVMPPTGLTETDTGTPAGAIAAYTADLQAVGFQDLLVIDLTGRGWERFNYHSRAYFGAKRLLNQINDERRDEVFRRLPGGSDGVAAHLFATGTKDPAPEV